MFLLLPILMFVFWAPKAHADLSDFVINDFHGRYQLFNDVPGGRMQVTETLTLTFTDQNHGILRALPQDYKDNSLKLKVGSITRDGSAESFTTYTQNDNTVLKIGDAGSTITGQHTYEIHYEMQNIISFFDNYDEWYWDINGDQWQQPFEKVSGEVLFPSEWQGDNLPAASCYSGATYSTRTDCVLTRTDSGYSFSTNNRLQGYETLTVAIPMKKGVFTPRTRADWVRENTWQLVGLAVGLAGSAVAFRQWWQFGKDHKGRGVIVPEYEPPKGLTPAEVGLLMDYTVDGKDLSATIIDLAVRGYIKVHEEEKQTLGIFKSRSYSLELVKDNFSELKPHESAMLEALFTPATKGTIQKLSDIDRNQMYSKVTSIRSKLRSSLTNEYGLFEVAPKQARRILWGLGLAALLAVPVFRFGWGWIVGTIWISLSATFFGALMRRRSHAGVETYDKVKGLQLYLNTAEKDRLKMLQSTDRPYAPPAKTVELFEKLLPFAVALGVEKSWAKQFEHIYSQPPDWYDGNFSSFNAVYFTNSLTSGVSAMNSTFTASSSSSSSGSGGGGFSGGGGGGGGGGGW